MGTTALSDEQVGARVAAIRRLRGIGQRELAAALGYGSANAVSLREKGRTQWTTRDLGKAAEVLDVPVSTLIEPNDRLMKEIIGNALLTGGA